MSARKKYRPRQSGNYCIDTAMHPVARSLDRERLKRIGRETEIQVRTLADWEHSPAVAKDLANTLGIAVKSIEGWDDPDDVGGVILKGIQRVTEMALHGHVWRLHYTDDVCAALRAAIQLLTVQDPRETLKAWAWAESVQIAQRIAQEVSTCHD